MKNCKEIELITLIATVRELEEQYESISCLQAPKAYTRIEEIHDEIIKLASEISNNIDGVSTRGILKVYNDIVTDVRGIYHMVPEDISDGIREGIIQFQIYDIHKFLDVYVTKEQNQLFSDLFWFADIETRVKFLENRYLCDFDIYYTQLLDYLVLFEVNEEALKLFQKK